MPFLASLLTRVPRVALVLCCIVHVVAGPRRAWSCRPIRVRRPGPS